jgi:hypothetical protein
MRDYMSLSDADLVVLHDELGGESDRTSDSGAECSPLEQELSRRANDLCTSLDSKTAVCCRLDSWSLRVSGNTENLAAPVLAGCVYGHCELPDGTPIVTSPLQMIVRTAGELLTSGALMSPSVNKVILLGNIGRDAETKFTPNDIAVTKFSLATTHSWKDQSSDEWKEETNWTNVILWRNENLASYLTKGQQVYLEGRLQSRFYEDKDAGST